MSDGKNPCDVCKRSGWASGCDGCVLDHSSTYGECGNDDCMCNYECGCLLGLDDVCKASTCYRDDPGDHSCDECKHRTTKREDGCEIMWCELNDEEIDLCDDACEDFEEDEG